MTDQERLSRWREVMSHFETVLHELDAMAPLLHELGHQTIEQMIDRQVDPIVPIVVLAAPREVIAEIARRARQTAAEPRAGRFGL